MKIAVAADTKEMTAVIPGIFDDAKGLLIIETDDMEIVDYVTDKWLANMVKYDCEVLICGDMYDPPLFEGIAGAGITRYYGGGLTAGDAAEKMLRYEIPMITDYVGGQGCGPHGDPANCAEHHHE